MGKGAGLGLDLQEKFPFNHLPCNVIIVSAHLNFLINMLLFPIGHVNQVN